MIFLVLKKSLQRSAGLLTKMPQQKERHLQSQQVLAEGRGTTMERVTWSHHLNTTLWASAQWEDAQGLLRWSSVTTWPQPKTHWHPLKSSLAHSHRCPVLPFVTAVQIFVRPGWPLTQNYCIRRPLLLMVKLQSSIAANLLRSSRQRTEWSRSRGEHLARLQQQLYGCQHPAGGWQGRGRTAHTWGSRCSPCISWSCSISHHSSCQIPSCWWTLTTQQNSNRWDAKAS